MNHHALKSSIYQPLSSATEEIRLLQIEGAYQPCSTVSRHVDTKQTRLLDLLEGGIPSPRGSKTAIRSKLKTFKLQEAPPYCALSYTWGDTTHSGSIEVDEQTVSVGRNLLSALQRIRRDHRTTYLWADALCINQSDHDEKSYQVPLMSQIYGRAETVVAWLGEEQDLSSQAFCFLRTSASYARHDECKRNEAGEITASNGSSGLRTLLIDKAKPLSTKTYKEAVQQFFENPYWRRVWVLQEVARTTDVFVLCGRHSISLELLIIATLFWDRIKNLATDVKTTMALQHEIGPFLEFRDAILGFPDHPSRTPQTLNTLEVGIKGFLKDFIPTHSDVLRLIVKTRSFRATDSRDKVYALLNFLRSDDAFLDPDYTRSEAQLYSDITTSSIRHYDSLFCISMGGIGLCQDSPTKGLPSWIPDFRKIGDDATPYANPVFMSGYSDQPEIDACRSKPPEYSFNPEESMYLSAKGFLCDEIKMVIRESNWHVTILSIAESLKTKGSTPSTQTRLYGDLFRCLFPQPFFRDRRSIPSYPFNEALRERRRVIASMFMLSIGLHLYRKYFEQKLATIQTEREAQGLAELTKRQQIEFFLAEGDPALSYVALAIVFEGALSREAALHHALYKQVVCAFGDEHPDDIPLPYHQLAQPSSLESDMGAFLGSLNQFWSNRAFVLTKGGFMGVARPGTRVGDKVCILYGSPVPLVVRRDMGEYLLVGDCYLEGMMQGEMVQKQEAGDFILENITLK